ncbi:outer membrane beta-barrel family protein [Flavobacterium sp. N502536]|uniref:outer membrane beta-barrel family protein n=1 Tax=Flavobacterium sp. N502536 TaxID=2986837 RepID=UPI002222D86D|nr:outer membrane beta-barrel family protein [Flavobacterium sp. N502536]
MSKIYISTFLLMIVPTSVFSQIKLTGKIVNQNESAIELAEIIVFDQDSTIIKSELSSSNGEFVLLIDSGKYFFQIKKIGIKTVQQNIDITQNIDLGIIRVNENKQNLDEVVVTSKKKVLERKIDRLVFNVESSIAATGGDVIDILKLTPRIKVQNDQIAMIGKSEMSVMIDDRLLKLTGDDLINYLRTLKAEQIKSIEVITNPPSKYNADGNSGIINIKTKKLKNDSWNSSIRSVYHQATYAKGETGISFNAKKNKITLNTNLTYANGSNAPVENRVINYPDISWKEEKNKRDYSNVFSTKLGLDYKITDKISTGFLYNGIRNKPSTKENILSTLSNLNSEGINSLLITNANNERNRISNSLNYNFIYKIDTVGKVLSLDFDYFDYKIDTQRFFETNTYSSDYVLMPSSFVSAFNVGNQKIKNYSFNIDMEHPTKLVNLNYGGRFSCINTNNGFSFFDIKNGNSIKDPLQSNEFLYKEDTQALYFSAQKELGEKWDSKFGLRLENTQTTGNSKTLYETHKVNYTKLFPTFYVSYTPNDNNSFSLNYGRRINRPDYNFLNPFVWIYSPYSFAVGNPFLQPSYSQNFEFEYAYKDSLISSFYFSYLENGFEEVAIINAATNVQKNIPQNFLTNKMAGFNQTIIIEPFQGVKINFYADVYYSSTSSKIPVTLDYLKSWNGEFSLSNDYTLNKKKTIVFNLSYIFATNGVDNLDTNTSFNQLNATLKVLLLEKKLNISLNGNDILSSSRTTYTSYSNDIKTSFRNYYDSRYFRLAIVYDFGKKFKTLENKNINEEEYNRTK